MITIKFEAAAIIDEISHLILSPALKSVFDKTGLVHPVGSVAIELASKKTPEAAALVTDGVVEKMLVVYVEEFTGANFKSSVVVPEVPAVPE